MVYTYVCIYIIYYIYNDFVKHRETLNIYIYIHIFGLVIKYMHRPSTHQQHMLLSFQYNLTRGVEVYNSYPHSTVIGTSAHIRWLQALSHGTLDIDENQVYKQVQQCFGPTLQVKVAHSLQLRLKFKELPRTFVCTYVYTCILACSRILIYK